MANEQQEVVENTWLRYVITMALVCIAGVALVLFFERLPIEGTSLGIDWEGLWRFMEGGVPHYGTNLRLPPWSLIPVLPLGLLPMRVGWGLLTLMILGVLISSIPKNSKYQLMSMFLLISSFPVLRTIADGNFEILVTAGVLLILYGYNQRNPWVLAAGLILATAKVQGVWLLVIALVIYVLRSWPRRAWLTACAAVAVVVAPFMAWQGKEWLVAFATIPQRGSIMDSSLAATSARLGLPTWAFVAIWGAVFVLSLYAVLKTTLALSGEKAGMLITASLLLAPYAAGNSLLTVLAIGIIPLFQARPLLGGFLIALINIQYLAVATPDLAYRWGATYTTGLMILFWSVFARYIYRLETADPHPVPFTSPAELRDDF